MKDKLGIAVLFVCIMVAEGGIAYIWTNVTVENTKQEMEKELIVNMTGINISSKTGTLMFKIDETNSSVIKMIGPSALVGLFNKSDEEVPGETPTYNIIWKMLFENSTVHDAMLLKDLVIGQNYTIWYIDYTGFAKKEKQASFRTNVLIDVEKTK